jgi:hypothetical protein
MHKLNTTTSQVIEKSGNPLLQAIPEGKITHHFTYDFPSDSIQACHIRTIKPGDPEGVWSMPFSFFHLPSDSVRRAAFMGEGTLASSAKLSYYGIDASSFDTIAIDDAYLHADAIKTWISMASDLTFHHPELLSIESDSAAHIHLNILEQNNSAVTALSYALEGQPPASPEEGGWAVLDLYINPDTGDSSLNSYGLMQYYLRYSDTTNLYLGNAAVPSMDKVKNDLSLGVNITNLDPTVENPEMKGKIWTINDGITTVEAGQVGEETVTKGHYTFPNQSKRHGYKATLTDVDTDTNKLTIKLENWFFRYLGIYVQFLDSNDPPNPIKVSDLPKATMDSFPFGPSYFDKEDSKFVHILAARFGVMGIPSWWHPKDEISFIWPDTASSVVIIAGGWGGARSEEYIGTATTGASITAIINLGVPALFLAAGAALGVATFISDLQQLAIADFILMFFDLLVEMLADISAMAQHASPSILVEVGKLIGEWVIYKGAASAFVTVINKSLGEARAEELVPVVGKVLAGIAAVGVVTEIARTADQINNSPANYQDTVKAAHNITVTIHHDPDNAQGFPAVADYYTLTSIFDDGTPHTSDRIDMQGTTMTDPITYIFNGVPYGGHINITVDFYADENNWKAGHGSTGTFLNIVDSKDITIKENLVPLDGNTVYSHKQKIGLNVKGNHVWLATSADAPAPSQKVDSLQCENVDGHLCELTNITVSEEYGTLGYAWKSYSEDVTSCESAGAGSLYQFATASITQYPQDSYLAPTCGFSAPPRIVFSLKGDNNYYLDTTDGTNMVRQVKLKLGETPSIDGTDSNLSWGKFNLPSNALLLHPSGKMISINTTHNKIEILTLPDAATTDELAPRAVSYSGKGTRHGLVRGPVAAAISLKGAILILEAKNMRVQAFDTGMNPTPYFDEGAYSFPLKSETETVYYVDMAMESTGYIYILSYTASYVYRMDIYDEKGNFVSRTTDVNAGKLTVDVWRNVFTLNYEVLQLPQPKITEPSVSQWIPSVP